MTSQRNRFLPRVPERLLRPRLVVVGLALVVAGCATASPSPTPATTPTSTETPTAAASPSPAPPAPSGSPSAVACESLNVELASDRLVNAQLTTAEGADGIVFTFRAPSPEFQPGANGPHVVLEAAHPPFSMAGSGQVIDVAGSRFLELRFLGMSIVDASGNPTFAGARDTEVEYPILRQLTMFDESEGVVGWIAGLNGGGCPTFEQRPADGSLVLSVPA